MELNAYVTEFQEAVNSLDKKLLAAKNLEPQTGVWLQSVVLRLQKNTWANDPDKKPQSGPAIFFSVWLSEKSLQEQKLYYNIHALKLRQLEGYKIAARPFAIAFRDRFQPFIHRWPNVSTNFGPLTLMEGWTRLNADTIRENVSTLAGKFTEIDFIIDDLLQICKRPNYTHRP